MSILFIFIGMAHGRSLMRNMGVAFALVTLLSEILFLSLSRVPKYPLEKGYGIFEFDYNLT